MTTQIRPDDETAQHIVRLLSKPNAPVSRGFIDRMLNRSGNPLIQELIKDTLLYLHVTESIHRMYVDPVDSPDLRQQCPETSVYYWAAEKKFDGFFNAAVLPQKYEICGATKNGYSMASTKNRAPTSLADIVVDSRDKAVLANSQGGRFEADDESTIIPDAKVLTNTITLEKPEAPKMPPAPVKQNYASGTLLQNLINVLCEAGGAVSKIDIYAKELGSHKFVSMNLGRLVALGRIKRCTGPTDDQTWYWDANLTKVPLIADPVEVLPYGSKSKARVAAAKAKLDSASVVAGMTGDTPLSPGDRVILVSQGLNAPPKVVHVDTPVEEDTDDAEAEVVVEPQNYNLTFDAPQFSLSDTDVLTLWEADVDGTVSSITMPQEAVIRLKLFLNRTTFAV